MEEFLQAPRSLQLAEQGKSASTLQERMVGALNQFQAIQGQKGQHRVTDIMTWVRCFTLYIAVMAKKSAQMIPCMVAHLHTSLWLHQKASHKLAWLEYDIQFQMVGFVVTRGSMLPVSQDLTPHQTHSLFQNAMSGRLKEAHKTYSGRLAEAKRWRTSVHTQERAKGQRIRDQAMEVPM